MIDSYLFYRAKLIPFPQQKYMYEYVSIFSNTAQDVSHSGIFHIMNEIWQHFELMNKFIVGNHNPNF